MPTLPHTQEWFEQVHKISPTKAALARKNVERRGRDEVCSICGEDSHSLYELTAGETAILLRLCGGCDPIYRSVYGFQLKRFYESDI
ncbi:MAG TPA: hypothetical protein VEF76_09700 [Patescibacteria group bacterium]|nr:hypothetical protein [Patescibacteria group bacterium]